MKYIACAAPEEDEILFFGEGDTPEEAIEDFISESASEHGDYYEIPPFTTITIEAYVARYEDSWDEDEKDTAESQGFQWFLGKKVLARNHQLE